MANITTASVTIDDGVITWDDMIIDGSLGVGGTPTALSNTNLSVIGTTTSEVHIQTTGATSYPILRFKNVDGSSNAGHWAISVRGNDSNKLRIFDEGTQKGIVVQTNGNVGIGTSAPANPLHVNGSAFINGSVYFGSAGTNHDVRFYGDTSGQDLSWDAGSSGGCLIFDDNTKAKFGDGGDLEIHHNGNDSYISAVVDGRDLYIQTTVDRAVHFRQNSGERITLNTDDSITLTGNVGIGETAPANLLHVKASDTGIGPHGSAQIVLEREGTNYLQFLTAEAGTSGLLFGDGSDVDVGKISYDHNIPAMYLQVETAIAMTINSNQNISIGTTADMGSKLGVNSQISIGSDQNNRGILNYTAGSTDAFGIGTISDSTTYFDVFNVKQGQVMLNTTTPVAVGGQQNAFQITGNTSIKSAMSLARFSADANGPSIRFGKTHHGTVGNFTAVAGATSGTSDGLGTILWNAADGTDLETIAAYIEGKASANASSNNVAGRLNFFTNFGTAAATNRMTIAHTGYVGIGTEVPDALLHVKGVIGTTPNIAYFMNSDMGDASHTSIWIGKAKSNDQSMGIGYYYDTTAADCYAWLGIRHGDSPVTQALKTFPGGKVVIEGDGSSGKPLLQVQMTGGYGNYWKVTSDNSGSYMGWDDFLYMRPDNSTPKSVQITATGVTLMMNTYQGAINSSPHLILDRSAVGSNNSWTSIKFRNSSTYSNENWYIGSYGHASSNDSRRFSIANHDVTEVFTVTHNGNVGLGTTAPYAKIQAVSNNANGIMASDDVGATRYCSIGADSSGAWITGGSGASSHVNLYFRTAVSGSEGTAMHLDANKHAYFYNNIYFNGNGSIQDVGTANNYWDSTGMRIFGFLRHEGGIAAKVSTALTAGEFEEFYIDQQNVSASATIDIVTFTSSSAFANQKGVTVEGWAQDGTSAIYFKLVASRRYGGSSKVVLLEQENFNTTSWMSTGDWTIADVSGNDVKLSYTNNESGTVAIQMKGFVFG